MASRLPTHAGIESVNFIHGRNFLPDLKALVSGSPRSLRRRWSLERFSQSRRRSRLDLVHGPNYFLPEWAGRSVVTIHDLSVFRYPDLHPPERIAAFETNLRRSIDAAAHLITDCETVRREVIEFTGLDAAQVTAVPLGVSPMFRPVAAEDRAPALARMGLPDTGYGLAVSSLEPRKRIERLLHAWRILPVGLRRRYPLVIAGARGWKNGSLHDELRRAVQEGWAHSLGFVPEAHLPALYSGANLFVFPSVYEGFGLPPLEAMASGVPTVVAAGSCLEEVTQGAAMSVEVDDEVAFMTAIHRGLEDRGFREKAISSGIQVARGYTWERCADETVAVYQKVMSGDGRVIQ